MKESEHTQSDFSKKWIELLHTTKISEEKHMGTCPSRVFQITWGPTLCTKFEVKSDLTVAAVPS